MHSLNNMNDSNDYPQHGDIYRLGNLRDAGVEVRSLLQSDAYLQHFYAPWKNTAVQKGLEIDSARRRVPWNRTCSSQLILNLQYQNKKLLDYAFNQCKTFTLINGDKCPH